MSGIRQSFCFCREKTYKAGKADGDCWIAPPPGSFLSTTHNRSTKKIYTQGSKFFDTVAYGSMSGSWEWTFVADYEYFEPFMLAFDETSFTAVKDKDGKTIAGEYVFSKKNNKRVPSFCIRRKVLNGITGGSHGLDEESILYGCVVKSIRFSRSAADSPLNVTMSGFYADEQTALKNLINTDYQEYTGSLVEFSCMFIGEVSNENYVANTESLTIGIENGASAVYSVCSPFASSYAENQTSVSFGTTAYSNDPMRYKMRVYGGGETATPTNDVYRPRSKGMTPIPLVNIVAYNGMAEGDASNIATIYEGSTRRMKMSLDKVVIKSMTWQKGDGNKLQDQINSTEVRNLTLSIRSGQALSIDDLWKDKNIHHIADSKSTDDSGDASEGTSEDTTGGESEKT